MKKITNQSYVSQVGCIDNGWAKFGGFALFPLMLLMLLLLPANVVAQTEYDKSVTFTALVGNPDGYANETCANLFDGKKTSDNFSKWCCSFNGNAYVIFEASKAGAPVGYTITTGDDNASWGIGRNPLSWKLYGNNEGKDGDWTLIQEVSNDATLQDENYTSFDFTSEGSTFYKYFKWEISAIHSGKTLQVGEFELKLTTCSHNNTDGSSALGTAIETVDPTCVEHGYTTHECSICHSTLKVYMNDELTKHTLTYHELKPATCIETGTSEYWQCSVCNKLFSDADATTEIADAASLVIPANGHKFNSEGTCTVCQYEDSRFVAFKNLDGIKVISITDNGGYPWKEIDLNAEGIAELGFTIPEGSKGLMSSNYNVNQSSSETVIRLNVSKPILLTSQVLVSSEKGFDKFYIYVDNKLNLLISGKKQTEYKVLLSAGEHSLTLSYEKDRGSREYADRAFLCNLKTATAINDYVADYESSDNTLTFKGITSDNLEALDLSRIVMVYNEQTVSNMCSLLNIQASAIKNIVFEENSKTYAPTSLNEFFYDCRELETISGLDNLNTANVTNMCRMFANCYALTSLDLTNFNTANVTDMSNMFFDCQELSSLDVTKFNTANVTDMSWMFANCYALTSLDLTNFNTANVMNMSNMFYNCQKLSSLDISNFNTEKVMQMYAMFRDCSALTTIYASDKFKTGKEQQTGFVMFYGCTELKGAIDKYDEGMTDHTYANYKTGYFTKLVGKNGEEKIGATGETLATEKIVLDDDKDFVAYEPFAAKAASYERNINTGTIWGTLCLPFAIAPNEETECKFYCLTGVDTANKCITLESCEEDIIPAGTPVLFKMNEDEQTLSISAQDASIVNNPVAGTNADVNLVGSFTKIGGKDKLGLADTDYIISNNKFWRVSDLKSENSKGVGSKPMHAYIHPTNASQARAAMLSIGMGDSTTAIDNLNAISNDANAEYYDVNGHRTDGLQKGLNIVKRGSKTYKIMVK